MNSEASRARLAGAGLVVVILLGAFLRLFGLSTQVLWHDEVYTRIFAAGFGSADWQPQLFGGEALEVKALQRFSRHDPSRSIGDTVRGLARDEPQHPPLYYAVARFWVATFGDSIAILRTLSALAGLLCLPAIFWLAMELFASRRIAGLAVALFALSPFFVLYAREAREYALWTLWILLSMAALLRALRLTDDRACGRRLFLAWGLYTLCVSAGLYTAFFMAAPILAQVAFVAIRARGRLRRTSVFPALSLLVSAILFLPWALILREHYAAFEASMAWSREIIVPRGELFSSFALNLSRPFVDLASASGEVGLSGILAAGLALGLLLAALVGVARRAPEEARVLLGLTFALPVVFLLGPDLLLGGIRSISARYLTPTLLMAVLSVAYLLGREAPASDQARTRIGLMPLAGLLLLVGAAASSLHSLGQEAVWTKGVSVGLPRVARIINAAASAQAPASKTLIVANREQHNPGNLLALANLLAPGTKVVVRDLNAPYAVPPGFERVYLFSPTAPFREALEAGEHTQARLLFRDLYLQLWLLEAP